MTPGAVLDREFPVITGVVSVLWAMFVDPRLKITDY